jgi:hypothetical protein
MLSRFERAACGRISAAWLDPTGAPPPPQWGEFHQWRPFGHRAMNFSFFYAHSSISGQQDRSKAGSEGKDSHHKPFLKPQTAYSANVGARNGRVAPGRHFTKECVKIGSHNRFFHTVGLALRK